MKWGICYLCIAMIILLLVFLFKNNTKEYFNSENPCVVSVGDKQKGLDLRYDESCISKGGGLGCVAKQDGTMTGCRFCSMTGTEYPPCSTKPSTNCTPEGQSPFNQCPSKEYVQCCNGLDLKYVRSKLQCVKGGSGPKPPTAKCTTEGQDPFKQCSDGQYVSCCDGLDLQYVGDNLQCVRTGSSGPTPTPTPIPTPIPIPDPIPDPTNKCAGISCGNHGTCKDGSCVCTGGWSGDNCEIHPQPSDKCTGINCGDHGSCKNGSCVCTDGWTGDRCEHAPVPPPSGEGNVLIVVRHGDDCSDDRSACCSLANPPPPNCKRGKWYLNYQYLTQTFSMVMSNKGITQGDAFSTIIPQLIVQENINSTGQVAEIITDDPSQDCHGDPGTANPFVTMYPLIQKQQIKNIKLFCDAPGSIKYVQDAYNAKTRPVVLCTQKEIWNKIKDNISNIYGVRKNHDDFLHGKTIFVYKKGSLKSFDMSTKPVSYKAI